MRTIFSRVRFSVRFCHPYDFRTIFFMLTISVRFFLVYDFDTRTIYIRFTYDFVTCTISVLFCHAYDLVRYAYGANTIAYRDNQAFISRSKNLLYKETCFSFGGCCNYPVPSFILFYLISKLQGLFSPLRRAI